MSDPQLPHTGLTAGLAVTELGLASSLLTAALGTGIVYAVMTRTLSLDEE